MSEKITPERLYAVQLKMEAITRECIRAINQQPACPFVVLIGKLPASGWPRGKCIGSDCRGRFYSYDAKKLLAAIAAHGYVKIEVGETPKKDFQP